MRVTSSKIWEQRGAPVGDRAALLLGSALGGSRRKSRHKARDRPHGFLKLFCSARPARIFKDTLKTSSAYHLAITY